MTFDKLDRDILAEFSHLCCTCADAYIRYATPDMEPKSLAEMLVRWDTSCPESGVGTEPLKSAWLERHP